MIEEVLNERQDTHGDYKLVSKISQILKDVCEAHLQSDLTPTKAEALDMILHKIARIVCGNGNFKDHWVDIAGYATLAAKDEEQDRDLLLFKELCEIVVYKTEDEEARKQAIRDFFKTIRGE
nr:MAG TPA: Nucleotide modification associated domain 1 [Caudoviricetes sp.]